MSRLNRASLKCENLAERCLLSAANAVQVIDLNFDQSLTATIRTDGQDTKTYVQVDGSDYDDHVRITNYIPRIGSMTLHLEQWFDGRKLSSKDVTLRSDTLNRDMPLAIDAKAGNDQIINSTSTHDRSRWRRQ